MREGVMAVAHHFDIGGCHCGAVGKVATGDCSLRRHSFRAASETKEHTSSPRHGIDDFCGVSSGKLFFHCGRHALDYHDTAADNSSNKKVTVDHHLACTIYRLGGSS